MRDEFWYENRASVVKHADGSHDASFPTFLYFRGLSFWLPLSKTLHLFDEIVYSAVIYSP